MRGGGGLTLVMECEWGRLTLVMECELGGGFSDVSVASFPRSPFTNPRER